jgi:hemolysin-activating ACP:hemolysin acyltransferase
MQQRLTNPIRNQVNSTVSRINMPASKMLDDLKTILSLYRQFDRYNKYTDKELLFYILPSYELNQYKIHKQGEEVIAFTNWAFSR